MRICTSPHACVEFFLPQSTAAWSIAVRRCAHFANKICAHSTQCIDAQLRCRDAACLGHCQCGSKVVVRGGCRENAHWHTCGRMPSHLSHLRLFFRFCACSTRAKAHMHECPCNEPTNHAKNSCTRASLEPCKCSFDLNFMLHEHFLRKMRARSPLLVKKDLLGISFSADHFWNIHSKKNFV